ncbi:dnaJ homolog subfamily C member 21-like [Lytechinus variegatus]|uniref:dnaJ homolog subfamily C member 21-like n=1 Tax=Lytechinus variegatus TaxID=7654 RepID=UPI001BB1B259|nr:dnaJ homolog subfamily C member 21-like [Lytechinus variegatus]
MEISRRESYRILEVSEGSSKDEIRSAYKRQALKWHPDKHQNSPEATKKFQQISSAYERLMKPEAIEVSLTMEQMFDLFAHVFCGNRGFSNGFYSFADDTDSDSSTDFSYRPNAFRDNKSSREKDNSSPPPVTEAERRQAELRKEEEKLKKQKEKRRERKKRRKAKKKQEKEVRYGGGDNKKKGKKEVVPESSEEEEEEEEEEIITNKENIQANSLNGDSTASSPIDKSSKAQAVNGERSADDHSQTNINSHFESNSNHRKEVHDGHQQGEGDGRGREGVVEGGGGDGAKQTEGRKTQTKTKKAAGNPNIHNPGMSDSESDEETQGLDMNSAFFARAASGVAKKQTPAPASKTKKKGKGRKEESESIEDMDPQTLESRKLAVKGNEMASEGNYHAAIKFFSKAIDLNPLDFRFFGNRSFCYDHLQMYDHALSDADQAILLDKTWPKGHYRKGRALSGLKLYTNAEASFEHVLKLDKNCAEAIQELRTVRVYRLMEMGFGAQQSEAAILQFDTVQAALENLLAQGDLPVNGEMDEVYVSDEEDYITQTIQESKLDSRNPENLKSLWIGNLQPTVTEKELKDLFKPFGEVSSMRRMPEKFCAFVNYKDPRMASRAMDKLQGRELHGKQLLIKFPDNPIEQQTAPVNDHQEYVDMRYKNLILRKPQAQMSASKVNNNNVNKKTKQQIDPAFKMSGPVNGDECYFWRTTGCWYAERCRYKHLPESKGIDRK